MPEHTIAENLTRLQNAKTAIGNAITAKGGTVASGDGLENFPSDIATITNQYTSSDEGKVVSSGSLVAQTSTTATVNGTMDTTTNNEVVVNVPNTYSAGDEGKVVDNGQLVAQTAATYTDNGTYNTTTNNSVTVALPLATKSITSNGTYAASSDNVKGYTSVSVNVPNTYTASDEGKVVNNGALTSQTSVTKTSNGTYDTTLNNSVTINVPTYSSADNGKVIQNGALSSQTAYGTRTTNGTVDTTYNNSIVVSVPTYSALDAGKVVNTNGNLVAQNTGKSITSNGTGIDTTYYSSVNVSVPNSYSASDEGKVVQNSALVAQTAHAAITTNGTYDTTTNNSVTVNVSSANKLGVVYTNSSYTSPLYGWIVGITDTYLYIAGSQPGFASAYTRYINPSDIRFSDYLTANRTVTLEGYFRSSSSKTSQLVDINISNNTITFQPTGKTDTYDASWFGRLYKNNW